MYIDIYVIIPITLRAGPAWHVKVQSSVSATGPQTQRNQEKASIGSEGAGNFTAHAPPHTPLLHENKRRFGV